MNTALLYFGGSAALFLIGLYMVLVKSNLIKIVLGLDLMETAVNLFIVASGYIKDRTAPILNRPDLLAEPSQKVVDPVPHALVLTAIVIGVAVMAMALSIVIRIYEKRKTLNIANLRLLKW